MSQITDSSALSKRLTQYVRRAWAQLYLEHYAPVFALAFAIIAVFLIGAFGGVWERIGDPWRLIVLTLALAVLVRAFLKARLKSRPNLSAARRRVEQDSDVKHRPLDVLDDTPAISKDVWPAHFQQAHRSSEKLQPAKWRHVIAPMDKYYLRYALPCAVVLAMMVGFGDNSERLRRSLSPSWQSAINPSDISFEAWVDPPAYTGRPPLYFKDKKNIDVPAGSELVARISGSKDAPRLKLHTQRGARYIKLKRLGPKSFEARTILETKSTARWRIGTLQKKWALNVLPDTPPTLSVNSEMTADKRDRLSFTYSFEDDYGVEELSLKMRLLTDKPSLTGKTGSVNIPLASGSVKRAEDAEAALDMTKHEWAGRKVAGRLFAKDGLGQTAESEEVFFTVPDKIFIEPLAKAIIEQRGLVIDGHKDYAALPPPHPENIAPLYDLYEPEFRMDRSPAPIQRAAFLIDVVTDKPAGLFQDPAIYMGLRNVHGRLRYAREQKDLRGIPEDLWAIALRAEFGVLGTAFEEMQEAKQALQDGMARRAPQREIDTLFERYDEAVERYMEELRRKAIEEGNIADAEGGGQGGQNADEIEELLKAIEEANRIGDVEGARKALARLAELLENMEIQLTRGGEGEGGEDSLPGEMSEEMKKSLEELADLLGEQRELQDETRQAENEAEGEGENEGQQQGQNGGEGSSGSSPGEGSLTPGELARRQSALEKSLEALAEAIPEEGETGSSLLSEEEGGQAGGSEESEDGAGGGGEFDPESDKTGPGGTEDDPNAAEALAEAGEAMQRSRESLENGDIGAASGAQKEAIQALRRAGQALAEAGRQSGEGEGEDGDQQADNDNPLGQNQGNVGDDSEADIDTKDNATRARELREELRRRSSEQDRERLEREYLERLLKRF